MAVEKHEKQLTSFTKSNCSDNLGHQMTVEMFEVPEGFASCAFAFCPGRPYGCTTTTNAVAHTRRVGWANMGLCGAGHF